MFRRKTERFSQLNCSTEAITTSEKEAITSRVYYLIGCLVKSSTFRSEAKYEVAFETTFHFPGWKVFDVS